MSDDRRTDADDSPQPMEVDGSPLKQHKEDDYRRQSQPTQAPSKFTPATLRMIEAIWGPQAMYASALMTPRVVLCSNPRTETAPPARPATPPPSTSAGPPPTEERIPNEVNYYSEEEEDEPPNKKPKAV